MTVYIRSNVLFDPSDPLKVTAVGTSCLLSCVYLLLFNVVSAFPVLLPSHPNNLPICLTLQGRIFSELVTDAMYPALYDMGLVGELWGRRGVESEERAKEVGGIFTCEGT